VFPLLLTLAFAEDEVPVPLSELPEPVKQAVEDKWPGCTFLEAEREGRVYDVEVKTAEGERWEAEVTPKGRIVDVEREDDEDDEDDEDGD
jgi:hypothetical protein